MELGRGSVELRNGGSPVLRCGDRSVVDQPAPQAVHDVEHVRAAGIAHVAAVFRQREVDRQEPPTRLQLRRASEEDVLPVGKGACAQGLQLLAARAGHVDVIAHRARQRAQPVHRGRGEPEVDRFGRKDRLEEARRRGVHEDAVVLVAIARDPRPAAVGGGEQGGVVVAREVGIGDAHRAARGALAQRRDRRTVEVDRGPAVGRPVVGDVERLAETRDVHLRNRIACEVPSSVDDVLRAPGVGGVVTLVPHRDRRSCPVETAHAAVPFVSVDRIIGGRSVPSARTGAGGSRWRAIGGRLAGTRRRPRGRVSGRARPGHGGAAPQSRLPTGCSRPGSRVRRPVMIRSP